MAHRHKHVRGVQRFLFVFLSDRVYSTGWVGDLAEVPGHSFAAHPWLRGVRATQGRSLPVAGCLSPFTFGVTPPFLSGGRPAVVCV